MGRRPTLALVLALPVLWIGMMVPDGSAGAVRNPHYRGDAPGSVTCDISASVIFSPRLTESGGGTSPSATTGKLTDCTTTDGVVKITSGSLTGSFAPANPPTCTDLASLTTPATLAIHWKGLVAGAVGTTTYRGKANFTTSIVSSSNERFSPSGHFDLQLLVPGTPHGATATGSFAGGLSSDVFTDIPSGSLDSLCDSKATGGTGQGIRKVTLNGTIAIGANQGTQLDVATMLATDADQSFCAVLTAGTVRCWGDNSAGQLGDGTTRTSSVAMAVSGVTNVSGIASDGDNSFCAVLTTGGVECWGANGSGELGDGTTTESPVPVVVTGITNALSVTSDGNGSYCAVLQSGSINCWGSNSSGQLGNGTESGSSLPVNVVGITNDVTVTSDGNDTFCALLTSGGVDCWGAGNFGQLGDNSTGVSLLPATVTGLTNGAAVSSDGDDSFCALLTTGGVECWGANFAGELGNGTTAKSTVPVVVTGITTAMSVSDDGNESYCAVLTSGAVECWGSNNFGELGNGTTTNSSVPVSAVGITDAASISSDGDDSFCALLTTTDIDCWGANFAGELGDGTTTASSVPAGVTGVSGATDIAGGIHPAGDTEHAYCAVVTSRQVDCWGSNRFGELGDASTVSSAVPMAVIQP